MRRNIINSSMEVVPFTVGPADDWRAVCLQRVSVLLEGPATATEAVVRQLLPHLRQPVVSIRSGADLSLPTVEIGTPTLGEVHI